MPSANDVYITPASRKIEIYSGSAVHGLVSGSGGDVYVSGSGDLYLDAAGNNIVLKSAGTTFAKLNNNNAYWDFDGNAGSSYLRFIPWNGGAGTTAYTYWGDGTNNQVIYLRGTDSINTNSITLANTYIQLYDGAGNSDTFIQAGGASYFVNPLGIGLSTTPGETLHVAGTARITGKTAIGSSTAPSLDGISVSNTVQIAEKSSISSPAGAGWGTFWVSGSTPNVPMFTNDAGTTIQLGSASPGGSDTQVQFNDGGSFGGSANFTWDDSQLALTGTAGNTRSLYLDPAWAVSGDNQYSMISGSQGLALAAGDSYVDLWVHDGRALRLRQQGSGDAFDGGDNIIAEFSKTGNTSTGGPWGVIMKAPSGNLALQTVGAYDLILDSHDSLQFFFDNEYTMYSAADGNSRFTIREHSKAGMEFEGDGDITFKDQTSVNMTLTSGGSLGVGMTPDNQSIIDFQGKLYGTVNGTTKGNFSAGASSFAHTSGLSNYGGSYSTGIGFETLKTLSGNAHRNTAVGYRSMYGDSTGIEGTDNTAVGASSMLNIKDGQYNVAVGVNAAAGITDGLSNTAIGVNALQSSTTANYNTVMGVNALKTNVDGDYNTAIGYQSMLNYEPGDGEGYNVAIGAESMLSGTTGEKNISIGYHSLWRNTIGDNNVAVGHEAGRSTYSTTSGGSNNTFMGYRAAYYGSHASGAVAIGYRAGRDFGYNNAAEGNTAVGYQSGFNTTNAENVTLVGALAGAAHSHGNYSTAVGVHALYGVSGQTSGYNTAIGAGAMRYASGSQYNVAIGDQALSGASTGLSGDMNVAIGRQTMVGATTARDNTVIGTQAGQYLTGGVENTVVGFLAGRSLTNGNYNTLMGWYAGYDLTSSHRNTFLGYGAGRDYNQTGDGTNTAVGMYAMFDIETGSANATLGYQALAGANGTDNDRNVAIGAQALFASAGGSGNVGIGYKAGYSITTGHTNVAIGEEAGYNITEAIRSQFIGAAAGGSVTTGQYNTIIGYQAGNSLTVTGNNVLIGKYAGKELTKDYNTMVGIQAGQGTTTGINNTYIGANAAKNSSTGYYNVAVGNNAGNYLSGATGRVDIGYGAGYYVSGNGNTFIGYQTGYGDGTQTLNTANYNTAVGLESMKDITSGIYNVGMGYNALANVTTGKYNVVMGTQAGEAITTHDENTLVGNYAGQDLTGQYNVFLGSSAGFNATTSDNNVAIGRQAMAGVMTGDSNVGVGYRAGYANTSGGDNVFIGVQAGNGNTTASNNVAVGKGALYSTQDSSNGGLNTAIGQGAGADLTGHRNTMLGYKTGYTSTSANSNVAIGYEAGYKNTTGDSNVFIGNKAGPSSTNTDSNKLYINNDEGTPLIGGDFSADTVDIDGDLSTLDSHKLKVVNASSDYWAIYNQSNGKMRIDQGTTQRVLASSGEFQFANNVIVDGEIGIGTSAPSAKLHLKSSSSNEPTLLMENTNADDSAAFLTFNKNSASPADGDELGYIQFKGDDSAGNSDTFADIYASAVDVTSTTEDASLNFRTMSGGTLTGVMSLGYDGNGFGMNLFTASGAGCTQINYPNVNNAYMMFGSDLTYSSGSNTWRPAGFSTDGNPDPNDSGGGQSLAMQAQSDINITAGYGGKDVGNASADITFKTASGSIQYTPAERMRILGNGNVGIGTSAPAQKLHVEGGFRFRDGNSSSQRLEGFGWNDNFALVVSGTDALGLAGGTPGVRFLDQSANEHLAIKESGTNHAQFMAGGENLLVMTNDKVIMDDDKGIEHAVTPAPGEWLPDAGGSTLEAAITTYAKIQLIRTDNPPINWPMGVSAAKLMLPAATAGREHIIVWSENQSNLGGKTFSLNPAAGGDELWKGGVSGPVGINKNTGESIHVICAEAGIWSVVAHT